MAEGDKLKCHTMRRTAEKFCTTFGLLVGFLGIAGSKQAATVRMLVRDQTQVLDAGQSLEIACEFQMDDFELFENPIIWTKSQGPEQTRINIMSNIVEPYIATGRFSVTFVQTPPRYKLLLNIIDISLPDYGNYTCEVRGKQTTVLAALTHYLYVKSPIKSIAISTNNRTITYADIDRSLEFTEGDTCSLRCVSYGGCPAPNVALYLGNHEITGQFSLDHTSRMTGVEGLRTIEHRVERWTNSFRVSPSHNNKRLQCVVTVLHSGSSISTVRLKVRYAPVIVCDKTYAFAGDRNVYLRCDVHARPALTSLYWTVDGAGSKVSEDTAPGEKYWMIHINDTRLYMRVADPENFREYTLVAENIIGRTTEQVSITRKFNSSSSLYSEKQFVKPSVTYMDTRNSAYDHRTSSASCIVYIPIRIMVLLCFTCRVFVHPLL